MRILIKKIITNLSMENGVFDLYPIKHMEIAVTGKDKKNRFILIPWSITNTGKQQE